MSKKPKGSKDPQEARIKKLEQTIRDKNKIIGKLKGEISTLQSVWNDTGSYLKDITGDKPLSKIIDLVNKGKRLPKDKEKCPKCDGENLDTMVYPKFHILSCSDCRYRKRFDEEEQIEKNKKS